MPPKRAASAPSKAASASRAKSSASSRGRQPAPPATEAAAPTPRVTRSRAAAAATAPAPILDNPEPRKLRKAAANENAPVDRTEAPVPAGKDTPEPAQKRQRRKKKPASLDDLPTAPDNDEPSDEAAAGKDVPIDAIDRRASAGDDVLQPTQQQTQHAGSDDLPAAPDNDQADAPPADAALPAEDDALGSLQPTPQSDDSEDIPAVQANVPADIQAVTTAASVPVPRRLDTIATEIILEIFAYLPPSDLAAVAPVKRLFHEVSNQLLYRRIVGLFQAPEAIRLCLTMIRRRNFSLNTLVFDGQHIAAQLPQEHLKMITGALQTTKELQALALPSITDKILSDCVHPDLRVLRVLGPSPPYAYIARHPWLEALEFHPASVTSLNHPARLGPGAPLAFVRCCMVVAAQLLTPRPPPQPVGEDGRPLSAGTSEPPPRTLAKDSILEVCPSTSYKAQAKIDGRRFLTALAATHRAPGTLVLDRFALEDLATAIDKAKEPIVVLTISRIRAAINISHAPLLMKYMQYIKSILQCFERLTTLELCDDQTPVPMQVNEDTWLDDRQLHIWKMMRPSLRRVVSPQKRAYAYRHRIWNRVADAVDEPNPFQLYGL